jgi:dienelactone hydrolase
MKHLHRALCAAVILAFLAPSARAAVRTEEVEYRQGETVLQGYFAWDDAAQGPRPGVLVVHEWWGHNAHARRQAERLAASGYVAFALDMFGKGRLAAHPSEAPAFVMEMLQQAGVAEARFDAALAELKARAGVDSSRIGAVGYCFGGGVVLEMARAGKDLDAVATFHGSLATETPAPKGRVRPQLLVLTGAADPLVPEEQVKAFEKEMKAAGARAAVIRYPGVKHSFTNPDAGTHGMPQLEYDARADERSWNAMLRMFRRVLK